jgi:predicted nuclease of restriction endonuclease-like RecB superfamily
MRLALADIPKSFSRRDGRVYLAPRLLRPRDLREELAALIALYEASLGMRRGDFPNDRPAELIGEYRLARSLSICLSEWYCWQSEGWPGTATEAEAAALAAHGVTSPTALRLALYDFAQATAGGYLPSAERETRLGSFAASLGVARATLDALLALDDTREERLRRVTEATPDAAELAARYNQRAVEALLANASQVEWRVPPEAAEGSGGGLGAVVKRVCFLARRMGVNYDVAFEYGFPDLASDLAPTRDERGALVAERRMAYAQPGPRSLDAAGLPIIITLYGPQELMGAPNHYGARLARLCRALLGYRREVGAGALHGALSGWATVYLRGVPFTFTLDDRLLRLLRTDALADASANGADVAFDSLLERRLYEDFTALERAGEAAGWRLEREPEPLLFGETILVPDFALTRDQRRVYLEVAGYWRPGYRERKARKLLALGGAIPLVVAAPEDARVAFGALERQYPFLWYRSETLSAPALLATLLRAYDDYPARLAALDLPGLLGEVARRGRIGVVEAQAALHSYTRDEVAATMDALARQATAQGVAAPEWLEGLGLCAPAWLDALASAARAQVEAAGGRLPLALLGAPDGALAELAEASLEALARRAGLLISRASLFAAEALTPECAGSDAANASEVAQTALADAATKDAATAERPQRMSRRAQPRKGLRRTSSGVTWNAPTMFPPELAGDEDAADPLTPTQADE